MKNLIQMLLLGILLAGCSGLPNIPQLLASPTSPPPADTPTPFATKTPVPTQNLFATSTSTPLTYTPTVTQIGAELFTPTSTTTPFPTAVIPTLGPSGGASSSDFLTPNSIGFVNVLTTSNVIYWNAGPCMPRDIKMSVIVADVINTDRVLLFMRLREKKNTLNLTNWGSGAIMVKADDGSFNYDIRTFNIHHYYYFGEAWLEYQLVAYTKDFQEIGRTPIYDRNLSLIRCQPVQ
ncbi:MAG TPA: hypothetical protein VK249_22680 [Anaerolineales bacterium]|nr:hypothetical protein [Anaerolineales bacterium]